MVVRPGRVLGTIALLVALVALVVAVGAVLYEREVAPVKAATAQQNQVFTQLTGLNNQATRNTLESRFTDANDDLVADAPTDPSKQIDPPALTFNYLITDDDEGFPAAFKELMAAVSKATGKPVSYVRFDSVDEKLRALRDGKLAFCGLNTGSVPRGVCTAGFVPVCEAADAAGESGNHMLVIAPAGSPLSSLADLRATGSTLHELTLTEPNSNSGYKLPLVVMRENGMVPPSDYLIRYSQGQVQSIDGIKSKQYEAAAVASDVLTRQEAAGKIAPSDYKVLYTSDQTFPGAALGMAYNLKPALAEQIRSTLLSFDWQGTGLAKLFAPKVKFVPANYKKDFEYVRRIDDSIGYAYVLPDVPVAKPVPATTKPTAAAVGSSGGVVAAR